MDAVADADSSANCPDVPFPANAIENPLSVEQLAHYIETASDDELLVLFEQGAIGVTQLDTLERHYSQGASNQVASAADGLMALYTESAIRTPTPTPKPTLTPPRQSRWQSYYKDTITPTRVKPQSCHPRFARFADEEESESPSQESPLQSPSSPNMRGHAVFHDWSPLSSPGGESIRTPSPRTPHLPCVVDYRDLENEFRNDEMGGRDGREMDEEDSHQIPKRVPSSTHLTELDYSSDEEDVYPAGLGFLTGSVAPPAAARHDDMPGDMSDDDMSSDLSTLPDEDEEEDDEYVEPRTRRCALGGRRTGTGAAARRAKSQSAGARVTPDGATNYRAKATAPLPLPENKKTFKTALWDAINNPAFSDYIHWLPDGQSGLIPNKDNFKGSMAMKSITDAREVSGLIRQLNMWGFQRFKLKHGDNSCGFTHPKFRRGEPGLLAELTRKGEHKVREPVPRKTKRARVVCCATDKVKLAVDKHDIDDISRELYIDSYYDTPKRRAASFRSPKKQRKRCRI